MLCWCALTSVKFILYADLSNALQLYVKQLKLKALLEDINSDFVDSECVCVSMIVVIIPSFLPSNIRILIWPFENFFFPFQSG